MNYKHYLALFCLVFIFNSCDDDTDCCPMPEEETQFESGIFVLNEGNFGSGNASVSFIDSENEQISNNIFSNVNSRDLGDTAQSIEMVGELALIVLNVSNRLEIVNRYTFESLGTIDAELNNPRYAVVEGDKIYVSNWGDGMDPDDDFLSIFSLNDLSFLGSVPVPEGPEKMVVTNNTIYVAHTGGFSFNNIVSVVDTQTNSIIKEIEVGDQPNSMVVQGIDLWVLASGKPAYADEETPGELSRIDITSNELAETYEFPESSFHPSNLSLADGSAYFTAGKALFRYNFDFNLPETAEFSFDEISVLYGFEIRDGKIYIASPNSDFTGNGNLYIYDLANGSLLEQFPVGINPNGIYFN
ncbi:YncE family protein [Gramella sp. BOM4]|nr:YncE family protein [Christiangramia bathymodioli]